MAGTRERREGLEATALEIVRRHGPAIMATARRYAASPEDAEDAYQRGLEILLTKAPTTNEDELVPWLRTVIKHEAFAIARQRERHSPVTDDGELADSGTPAAATHEQAERWERLRQGAEAIRRLKPQELRALLLKAEGYSYREICEITGWTYTKVNRCLTEGRRAFSERLEDIHAGAECERLAGRLSAVADGEASGEDLALLRPHLRTCLACRTRLREFRATPARVAALVPPAVLGASGDGGGLRSLVESIVGAAQHKAAVLGERAHAAAELATGQKVAAVAASAAALAGGGTAVDRLATPVRSEPPPAERTVDARPVAEQLPTPEPPAAPAPTAESQPAPAPAPEPAPASPPDPAEEFDPVAAASAPPATSAPPAATPSPADSAFVPGGSTAGGGGTGGEFAP